MFVYCKYAKDKKNKNEKFPFFIHRFKNMFLLKIWLVFLVCYFVCRWLNGVIYFLSVSTYIGKYDCLWMFLGKNIQKGNIYAKMNKWIFEQKMQNSTKNCCHFSVAMTILTSSNENAMVIFGTEIRKAHSHETKVKKYERKLYIWYVFTWFWVRMIDLYMPWNVFENKTVCVIALYASTI